MAKVIGRAGLSDSEQTVVFTSSGEGSCDKGVISVGAAFDAPSLSIELTLAECRKLRAELEQFVVIKDIHRLNVNAPRSWWRRVFG